MFLCLAIVDEKLNGLLVCILLTNCRNMEHLQDDLRDAKLGRNVKFEGCSIFMILVMLCLIIAIPCWFNAKRITYHGTVVDNHYSWKNADDNEYEIHYYCSVMYNNGTLCKEIVKTANNDDDITESKIQERTEKYCAMNSTKTVYVNYFSGQCDLEYNFGFFDSSIMFFTFSALFGVCMCFFLFVTILAQIRVRKVEREIAEFTQRVASLTPTQIPPQGLHRQRAEYQMVLMQPMTIFVENCGICLDSTQSTSITVLPCGHNYHKKCIEDWFRINKTCHIEMGYFVCPECRKKMECV